MPRSTRAALVTTGLVLVAAAVVAVVVVVRDDDQDPRPSGSTTTKTTEPTRVGVTGAPGVGDPYFPGLGNGGYDVEHYDLDLAWSADAGVLAGVATIDATATEDLRRLNLDLAGMEVRSVTVDGREAAVGREDRELVVTPAVTLERGKGFTTVVTYDGKPTPISEGTELFDVGWQTDGREAFVISEPSGAATFFPVNDHPVDKATYTIHVTAPDDQVVAANGLLVDTQPGAGTRTWTYEARDPMASYLVQVAIGDYELVDAGKVGGVVLRHAFHKAVAVDAAATTARTAQMLEALADLFGPYPFETYGVVAVDEPLGFALETQTLTLIGSDIASAGHDDLILLHEMAHQWVGDAVSPATWKDIWLNEGFATYAEWVWSERTGGRPAGEIARGRARGNPNLDRPAGDPGAAELFSETVYTRGALTLQALREAIGDPAFFEVLRTWVAEHEDGVASTADFVALAERLSGQQLDDLFERWLYAPKVPSL